MFLKKLLSITLFVASMSVYSLNDAQNTDNSDTTTPNTITVQLTAEEFRRAFPNSRLNRAPNPNIIPGFDMRQTPGTETQYFVTLQAPQTQNQNQ